jgi:ABC-2 type transport system permease protein
VPILLAAMAGLFLMASSSPALAAIGVAMPLVGPADLLTKGWASAGRSSQTCRRRTR